MDDTLGVAVVRQVGEPRLTPRAASSSSCTISVCTVTPRASATAITVRVAGMCVPDSRRCSVRGAIPASHASSSTDRPCAIRPGDSAAALERDEHAAKSAEQERHERAARAAKSAERRARLRAARKQLSTRTAKR